MTSIWTLVIVTVQPTVTGVSLTKWSNPINYLQETNKKVGCQSYDKMKQTKWTKIHQLQPTPQNCLVPRPHYSVQLIGSGHLVQAKKWGLVKNPQKWDKSETSYAVGYKTKVSHFKVKNTMLKDTDGRGKFKRMHSFCLIDKGRLFFTKLTPSRNSKFSSWRSTWPVLKQN